MAALTIEGTDWEVRIEGARRAAPRFVGSETEAFDGSLRSTRRDQFHQFTYQLAPLTTAQLATLTAYALAGKQTVSGDLIPGGPFECFIELSDAVPDEDGSDSSVYWLVSVTIRQAD
jgi:hypothetical protein